MAMQQPLISEHILNCRRFRPGESGQRSKAGVSQDEDDEDARESN